ncbi:hypothetical protein sphantq_00447 [Sphingobium sp. AntQ-1]|uniref:hypothetical protein n=1 Tax=Sphingobium sp. AntQ-1 TaxID=2930091 RepID=UPI00234EB59B|nr:hypothetical protein [Sphingobium sp. AntQ-1]WCP12050.1 hypothetical protein sphantq_00447 [Sphingobium sp. AntQ-1]
MEAAIDDQEPRSVSDQPRLAAWIWRPWYAKLWWTSIPIWWLGMAVATRVSSLEALYGSALAGYLDILFFPMTALMVLGVGYVRERLDGFVQPGDGTPLSDEEEEEALYRRRALEEHDRWAKRWRAGFDPADPRSGPLWIGNPLNPTNPGHINPHTGKFNAS